MHHLCISTADDLSKIQVTHRLYIIIIYKYIDKNIMLYMYTDI